MFKENKETRSYFVRVRDSKDYNVKLIISVKSFLRSFVLVIVYEVGSSLKILKRVTLLRLTRGRVELRYTFIDTRTFLEVGRGDG